MWRTACTAGPQQGILQTSEKSEHDATIPHKVKPRCGISGAEVGLLSSPMEEPAQVC